MTLIGGQIIWSAAPIMMVTMVVAIVHLGALGKRIVIIVTSGGVVELLVSFQV